MDISPSTYMLITLNIDFAKAREEYLEEQGFSDLKDDGSTLESTKE